MSFDAGSSEKVLKMPIRNRNDPNQSSTPESPSRAHTLSGDHSLVLLQRRSPVLLCLSGVASFQRLDYLLANEEDPEKEKEKTKEWNAFRDAIVNRVSNLNIIASLFITYASTLHLNK
ncbi:hypothetical protein FRB95_014242 [Tulasnella sp. JGI-2019a]|nr:hypothetical protein FRB95_014242 [Tulasnella sp. JGI-2019a]